MKNILKISKAVYFDPKQGVDSGTDVTVETSSQVIDDKLFYSGIYNRIFPDNFKGTRKKLRIELEYRGVKNTKQYDEDEKINLPGDLGKVNDKWWEKTWVQVFFVIGALASIVALYLAFKK
ncbi:MAG: hypothetical protein COV96_02060 [Candidatus Zambryskibacteria bacterium CG11_big_fil_rev_8_21_14_0_20_42_18]|nr:MAG: hypothetical protein COV96_02060 [Candidatus Zambryskibacteria bacterium CG11_big_fil_rev_8_21_14_0_20_42_18]